MANSHSGHYSNRKSVSTSVSKSASPPGRKVNGKYDLSYLNRNGAKRLPSKYSILNDERGHLVRIKDSYMFDNSIWSSKDPNGEHDYLLYRDKSSNEVRAIRLTHLYQFDETKRHDFNRYKYGEVKVPQLWLPSGVERFYFCDIAKGLPIDICDPAITYLGGYSAVPKEASNKIKSFGSKAYIRPWKRH